MGDSEARVVNGSDGVEEAEEEDDGRLRERVRGALTEELLPIQDLLSATGRGLAEVTARMRSVEDSLRRLADSMASKDPGQDEQQQLSRLLQRLDEMQTTPPSLPPSLADENARLRADVLLHRQREARLSRAIQAMEAAVITGDGEVPASALFDDGDFTEGDIHVGKELDVKMRDAEVAEQQKEESTSKSECHQSTTTSGHRHQCHEAELAARTDNAILRQDLQVFRSRECQLLCRARELEEKLLQLRKDKQQQQQQQKQVASPDKSAKIDIRIDFGSSADGGNGHNNGRVIVTGSEKTTDNKDDSTTAISPAILDTDSFKVTVSTEKEHNLKVAKEGQRAVVVVEQQRKKKADKPKPVKIQPPPIIKEPKMTPPQPPPPPPPPPPKAKKPPPARKKPPPVKIVKPPPKPVVVAPPPPPPPPPPIVLDPRSDPIPKPPQFPAARPPRDHIPLRHRRRTSLADLIMQQQDENNSNSSSSNNSIGRVPPLCGVGRRSNGLCPLVLE